MVDSSSYNLENLLNKDDLKNMKNVNPTKILEELNSKLNDVNLNNVDKNNNNKNVNNEEESTDDNTDDDEDDNNLLKLKEDSQKRRKELVDKLRSKRRTMQNNRKGKDYALKNNIETIKENPMYKNMGNIDISKVMQQIAGNLGAQSSKQKKMIKKKIDNMVNKMEEKEKDKEKEKKD